MRKKKKKKNNKLPSTTEENGLHQHDEDLKVELRCFLPGCKKKRLCQKKGQKNKATVF